MNVLDLNAETHRWWQQTQSLARQLTPQLLRKAWVWCWCRSWESVALSSSPACSKQELQHLWQQTFQRHTPRFLRQFPDTTQALHELVSWLSRPEHWSDFVDTLQQQRLFLLSSEAQSGHWLGLWYESTLDWETAQELSIREQQAAHFTPPALASQLVQPLLENHADTLPLLCDPSAGGGAFLLAALDCFAASRPSTSADRKQWVETRVYGVDLDPLAAEVCRLALWWWSGTVDTSWQALEQHIRAGHGFLGFWPALSPQCSLPQVWQKLLLSEFAESQDSNAHLKAHADLHLAYWLATRPSSKTKLSKLWKTFSLSEALQWTQELLAHWKPFHWGLEFPEVFGQRGKEGGFDLVLSNPPFGNAIDQKNGFSPLEKEWARLLAPEASKGAFDRAAIFAHLVASRLCRHGGRYALILPRSLLDGEAAQSLQRFLFEQARPDSLWLFDDPKLFEQAHLYLCALLGTRGGSNPHFTLHRPRQHDASSETRRWPVSSVSWWSLVQESEQTTLSPQVPTQPLEEVCALYAGCSTEAAYALAPLVTEATDSPSNSSLRLINTGLIDRYTLLWGEQKVRYLKQRYERPLWPELDKAPTPIMRAGKRQQRPKILLGGLTKVLEACLDQEGHSGGVVSTWVLWLQEEDSARSLEQLALLEVVLNSAVLSRFYQQHFGAQQSPWGGMTIRKRGLLQLPLPPSLWTEPTQKKEETSLLSSQQDPWSSDAEEIKATIRFWTQQLQASRKACQWADVRKWDEALQPWLSALYGLTRERHEALMEWLEERKRVRGKMQRGKN